jgi:hypothetical protein
MCGEALSARAGNPGGRPPLPFVAFAYELGLRRASGELVIASSGATLSLREGAVVTSELDALGRQVTAALARLAGLDRSAWSFRPGPADEGEGGRLLPLTQWARQHAERGLDMALAAQITGDLAGARLQLRPGRGPDPAALDATDRLLVTALAKPRDLRELASFARAPRFRLLAFVHFLRSVGALIVLRSGTVARLAAEPPPQRPRAAALELLGLPAHADAQRVKATFRGLARSLHPDLHPGAGEHLRRELERRLATVNAAYAALTAS